MEKNNQLNNAESTGNLQAALSYAARGWKVFPLFYVLKTGACSCGKVGCQRVGKHPTTRNGVLMASSDEATIKQWWTESPYANIGLATGHNGLIVLDEDAGIDKKTGQPKVGAASLRALIETNSLLPDTLIANTGGGGRHFYFLSTQEIKNSQDVVGKHLDIRGMGGYIILSPSNHESGNKYSWATPIDTNIADMPKWLEEKCLGGSAKRDLFAHVDAGQAELVKKSIDKDKFSGDQLVTLLQYIPADCDRDMWWQIGAALKKELGDTRGWDAWDAWSRTAPGKYDSKTALVQWNSFTDKGLTGGTIFHFAKENGFRGFETEAASDLDIVESQVFVASTKRFVELASLSEWDKEQIDAWYAPLFPRGKASQHLLKNSDFRRVKSCTYWPSKPQFVTEIDGQECLNYWRPSRVTPAPGEVWPFLNHVRYLFPEGEDGNILLDYLAFQVQHPGEKVHWAVLLEGDQGNGKSYFANVMRIVLGNHNVGAITSKTLHEKFTGWQRNCSLVIVEEMMARERLELMNALKPMITEDWAEIREMYKPPYRQPNRFNFLFFSNHNNALLLDKTDRRYCILKTDAPPHPDSNAYYAPLFDWTRANGPALAHYLGNRPLANFKPKAHAPMTAGKRAMIRESMLPIDQYISDQVEAREYPCQWDLIQTTVLITPLRDQNMPVNPKDVANAFRRLGFANLGKNRVSSGDDKVNMWAVRNFEVYKKMSPSQLRQVWLAQTNGVTRQSGAGAVEMLRSSRPRNPLKETECM